MSSSPHYNVRSSLLPFLGLLLSLVLFPTRQGYGASIDPQRAQPVATFARGLLTVTAEGVEVKYVFQTISSLSGVAIELVNLPSHPMPVTIALEQRQLEHALQQILQAIPSSSRPSYFFLADQHQIRMVKVFFPREMTVPTATELSTEGASLAEQGTNIFSQEVPAAETVPEAMLIEEEEVDVSPAYLWVPPRSLAEWRNHLRPTNRR